MASSISIREYIRWVPGKPTEPTSTLTLTSAESRFVDLRIYKPTDDDSKASKPEDVLPSSRVNWAVAGTSSTSLRTTPEGKRIPHSVWKHWVDVHSDKPEEFDDQGDMIPEPDGVHTVERGSMVNPSTGKLTEYEEYWLDVKVEAIDDGHHHEDDNKLRTCAVLLLHDDDHKARGMVVRLGQYCQGVVKMGSQWALERWEWKGQKEEGSSADSAEHSEQSKDWKRTVRVGDWWLPCGAALREDLLELGGEVRHQGMVWKVVELYDF